MYNSVLLLLIIILAIIFVSDEFDENDNSGTLRSKRVQETFDCVQKELNKIKQKSQH